MPENLGGGGAFFDSHCTCHFVLACSQWRRQDWTVHRHWLQTKMLMRASCNSCASLAGLVLCFIVCFILLVIAPLHMPWLYAALWLRAVTEHRSSWWRRHHARWLRCCLRNCLPVGGGCVYVLQFFVFFCFFLFFSVHQNYETSVLGNGWTDFHETFTKR